jgi:uncharacterized membrane protein
LKQRATFQSRKYYVIGGTALGVGTLGFIIFVIFLINQVTGSMSKTKVVVPGTQDIYCDEPGIYTVYYEYRSVINNKIYSTGEELPSSMIVTLTSETTGEDITLTQSTMNETYESGGIAGVSVFAFEIIKPGHYVFAARYADDKDYPEVVMAIGRSKLFGTLFSGLALFFVSFIIFIIGAVIIIVTFFTQRTRKQKFGEPSEKANRV